MAVTRRNSLISFGAVMGALGISLLLPNLFSDPNGVDPHELRLAAVMAIVVLAAVLMPRLRSSTPVALAIATTVIPFSLWSLSYQVFPGEYFGLDGGAAVVASTVQVLATVALILIMRWRLRDDEAPFLRLTSFGWLALLFTIAGVFLFIVGCLLLPAQWLGRQGIAPISALASFGNGLVAADVLQAIAQEIQFRGVLMSTLERSLLPWQANVAQATLFGLGHLALAQYEGPIGELIPITILLGLVFGWITQRTQSLWPVIVLHVVAEVAVRVAVLPGLYGT